VFGELPPPAGTPSSRGRVLFFYIPPLEEEVDSTAHQAVEDGGVLGSAMCYASIVRGVWGTPSPCGDSLFKRENFLFFTLLLLKRRWIQTRQRLKTEEF